MLKNAVSPRSLRAQLLSRSLFILAALLILIGALQYFLMLNFLFKNQAESMGSQILRFPKQMMEKMELYPRPFANYGDSASPTRPNATTPDKSKRGPFLFLPDTSLAIINAEGEFIPRSQQSGLPAPQLTAEEYNEIRENWQSRQPERYRVAKDGAGNEQLIVFRPLADSNSWNGMIQLGVLTAPIKAIALRQFFIFIILAALALLGGIMLYLPVLKRTLKPLDQMIESVEEIDAGNLDHRFPTSSGQTEIDRLADSFNGMLERLEGSFKSEREAKEHMRRFIADASHELRTPLTSIHGFLEVLLRGAAERPEQLYPALNSMLSESTRMKKLVEDLLLLAKLDRTPVVQRTDTRLDTLILEMEPHLRMLARERTVNFRVEPQIHAMCDADKIKQVVLNLFLNAVQHTDQNDGVITVTLSGHYKRAIITVQDNGAGIADEHLPYVFERFYRSDSSRARKHGGFGLGLSITQSIISAHGGDIQVKSELGQGTAFEVHLPAL